MVRCDPVRDPVALSAEFDRLAALEQLGDLSHSDHYIPWLMRQLPRRLGQVAEVGCGSGTLTATLAPIADRLLALDLSPVMLDLARKRCARWTNVTFEQADASQWQPAPRSLDAIVSVATLHHLEADVVLPRWAAALRRPHLLWRYSVRWRRVVDGGVGA
jgi:SAM-dependent methyltransferase